MRVALNVEQLLFHSPGGTGRYTAKLLELLTNTAPEDEVLPFCSWHSRARIEEAYRFFGLDRTAAARPHRLPLPRPLLYDMWHRLGMMTPSRVCNALSCADVVHAPSPAVPPRGEQPLVVTVHDAAFVIHPEAYPRRGRRFHELGVAAAARRADLIVTPSDAAAAELVQLTALPAERLRTVHQGVDQEEADPGGVKAVRHRMGIEGPYVLWVGSLEPRKGVGTLLAAFARFVQSSDPTPHELVLVGPRGWLGGGQIQERDVRLIGDRLRMLGPVDDATLRCLYAGADLFVFPSLHEGFGLPVLEAMVQRTPVVCSDIPALTEVTGGAAHLVPVGDVAAWSEALSLLLGHRELRDSLAASGRERARSFTWEGTVAATRAVYAEAVGR